MQNANILKKEISTKYAEKIELSTAYNYFFDCPTDVLDLLTQQHQTKQRTQGNQTSSRSICSMKNITDQKAQGNDKYQSPRLRDHSKCCLSVVYLSGLVL